MPLLFTDLSVPQERSRQTRDSDSVKLLVPVIVLVLGATVIPVELRRFDLARLSLGCNFRDLVVNVILFVPVGMVLSGLGFRRAVALATLLSLFAESCQFFMMYRVPSPFDLATNVAGAATGLLVSWRWRIHVPAIRLNVRTAWLSVIAALLVLAVLAQVGLNSWPFWKDLPVNTRGASLPGSVEADWSFDEVAGGVAYDSSGNGLDATLKGGAALADGIHGMAVRLNGGKDYVDCGHPVDLRLMGSMTISAWINATSFPADDAAIVSTFSPGYQLDTTVDRGPRTISFKLSDPCGNLVARYGATELVRDHWYHVAGVYCADARTLDVYLNGHLDDGDLLGPVAPAQEASSQRFCVGRRADLQGFEFAGLIDDVRIYSRALTQAELEQSMNGVSIGGYPSGKAAYARAGDILEKRLTGHADLCHQPTLVEDAQVPGLMVAVGMLSAMSCASFWPGHRLSLLGVSLTVGLLLVPAAMITLPPYVPWMLPLLSLAGGASVAVSLVRASGRP